MRRRSLVLFCTLALAGLVAVTALGALTRTSEQTPSAFLSSLDRPAPEPLQPRASLTVDGEEWSLGTYANAMGDVCTERSLPGVGQSRSCIERARLFANGRQLVALPGGSQADSLTPQTSWNKLWIYGFAGPRVASVELISTDCSAREISLDAGGAFFHVVSRGEIESGILPWQMLARAEDGSVVEERNVSIGLPANAKKLGHKAPSADC
jgi:hypothetical protein